MKTTITVFMLALALLLTGCGGPVANNAPANTNTNTARNAPAAPTVDALMALDKQANEAYTKGDSKFFETFLNDKFMMMGHKGERHTKADALKMIAGVKCDIKSMDLSEPAMAKIDNDTYAMSYRATWDGTCNDGPGGKSMKIPSPMRGASVFVRNGDKWQGVWHGETAIIEPKADAKKDDAKAADAKKDASGEAKKADATKSDATTLSAETKPASSMAKNDAKKPDDAKKAADAKPATATDAAPAAKPTASANTDALVKLHTAGWAAYGERDAKKLTDMTAANLSFVSPEGKWFGTKDEVIKDWTAAKCDIKSTSVADGFAVALSPTVELLFSKGTANGTCEGPDGKPMKLGSLWGSAIYVKEGNDWKMSFLFESPA